MRILLDTNVVLDAIAQRKPFYLDAQKIINFVLDNKLEGHITANSITDIYYIARKYLNQTELRNAMRSLFSVFSIIDVLGSDCHKALDFPLNDYEDALLVVCGGKAVIDYIITRDEEFLHEANLPIPVISPHDFIQKL